MTICPNCQRERISVDGAESLDHGCFIESDWDEFGDCAAVTIAKLRAELSEARAPARPCALNHQPIEERHRAMVLGCYGEIAMTERFYRFLKVGDNDYFLLAVAQKFADFEGRIAELERLVKP